MRLLAIGFGGVLLSIAVDAHAVVPGRGESFDCTSVFTCSLSPTTVCDGSTPCPTGLGTCVFPNQSCASDDPGCVSPFTAAELCADRVGISLCRLVRCVMGCHRKQARLRFIGISADAADATEDNCEVGPANGHSCRERFDAALAQSQNVCSPQAFAAAKAEEAVLIGHPSPIISLSLDAQNGGIYCDSTGNAAFIEDLDCSGGTNAGLDCTADSDCAGGGTCVREDTGWVPKTIGALRCEDALNKARSALVCCEIRCHELMNDAFFAGAPYDEESCEETNSAQNGCLDKFNKVRNNVLSNGLCPPCNDQAAWDAQSADAMATWEALNAIIFPCP